MTEQPNDFWSWYRANTRNCFLGFWMMQRGALMYWFLRLHGWTARRINYRIGPPPPPIGSEVSTLEFSQAPPAESPKGV